jgi:flagellum-specific peptidoglycan hydrolase FlgJ
MDKINILKVLQEMAVKPFGKRAVLAFDLEQMAELIEKKCSQYKVDPRLCLAQGILECHFGCNPDAVRSRKTKNIFNVGNVDDGRNRFFLSWEAGLTAYCHLMAREYCYRNEGDVVTAEMMIAHDFTRPRGGRYATAPSYTKDIAKLVAKIDALTAQEIK